MKKLLIIIILFGVNSCQKKELSGVWMSYNDEIININSSWSGNISGLIIDFDKSKIGNIQSDSMKFINIDFENNQLRTDNSKIDFKLFGKDSIKIEFYENTISVFHPLDLSHKISQSKNQIEKFLITNDFESISNSLKIDFLETSYQYDNLGILKNLRSNLLKDNSARGYWFVGEIRKNFFLFFNLIESGERNIYQILSIDKNVLKLKPIAENDFVRNVNELKPVYNNAHKKLLN